MKTPIGRARVLFLSCATMSYLQPKHYKVSFKNLPQPQTQKITAALMLL